MGWNLSFWTKKRLQGDGTVREDQVEAGESRPLPVVVTGALDLEGAVAVPVSVRVVEVPSAPVGCLPNRPEGTWPCEAMACPPGVGRAGTWT